MLDIYREVTDRVIKALENNVAPWKQPWSSSGGCVSYTTGRPYSLLNHLLLGGKAGEYITFQQAINAGGHVRRGEKSKYVVFWKPYYETVDPDTGEVQQHFVLRYYNVFHIDQTEGIKPRWNTPSSNLTPDAAADAIIADYVNRSGIKFTVTHSDRAYYRPSTDEVVVPELSQFTELSEWYSTSLHEAVHSTGHSSRLNRITDTAAFGSEEYSKEELVAELGSAYLVNYCGLETKGSFNNSAAYIQGWLKALKNDKRLLISAAGAAEKAVEFILDRKENDNGTEHC